jgi:hypothetical protein
MKTPDEIGHELGGDDETARIIAAAIEVDRAQRALVYTVTWTTTIKETYEAPIPRLEFDKVLAEGNGDSYLGDLESERIRVGVAIGGRTVFVNGEEVEW